MAEESGKREAAEAEVAMLAELARCTGLVERSMWAARWAARLSGADTAVLFVVDPAQAVLVCTGASGEGAAKSLRRTFPRETGLVQEVLRDRGARLVRTDEIASRADALLQAVPGGAAAVLVAPLLLERGEAGVVAMGFHEAPSKERVTSVERFLRHAAAAVEKAREAETKTAGLLAAVERLTNLYDVTKAFSSTIDPGELSRLVARKAADLLGAEVASFWRLEGDDVVLAATAVNENYDVSDPPEAVGGEVVGDVLASRSIAREDGPGPGVSGSGGFVRSLLAAPLLEEEKPIGAIAVANKRGRNPRFTDADEALLADLAHAAVRALHNVRLWEAERKVEQLDALLTVSREITATLDLDKVMATVVNASAALISFERCALAILQRGRLRLGAVSGLAEIDRSDASVRRTEALLEWVFFSGNDVAVTRQEDGTVVTDRPETEEKFRVFFDESGRRAFYGVVLRDDEGRLGVIGFECDGPIVFDAETRDLLQILVSQATVALRNAQLYQQVPLVGLWQPLLQRWRKVQAVPARRTLAWAGGALAFLAVLALVPWRIRVAGPARVFPIRRVAVTSSVDGFIAAVRCREGDAVAAGALLATLRDERYLTELAEATSAKEIAESELNRFRAEGDAPAMYQALTKRDALEAKIRLAQSRMARTEIRAPVAGIVVTPRLDEKTGEFLASSAEFCVLADVSEVTVEVAVPESEAAHLRVGEPLWAKMNPYPGRTFQGTVQHVAAAVHEEGEERFVIAESRVQNPEALLKPGMLGKAKVSIGRRSLATAIFRKPLRYVWMKLWPLIP
ncbi:MAG: GAF domain-containing protein [Thermoanaerobaculia bacterium]